MTGAQIGATMQAALIAVTGALYANLTGTMAETAGKLSDVAETQAATLATLRQLEGRIDRIEGAR